MSTGVNVWNESLTSSLLTTQQEFLTEAPTENSHCGINQMWLLDILVVLSFCIHIVYHKI